MERTGSSGHRPDGNEEVVVTTQVDQVVREIRVRWTHVGFHYWPDAPAHRAYLAARHRHLFHYTVTIPVEHHDREVEFHDLLDACRAFTDAWGDELGRSSCEEMAEGIARHIAQQYPGRRIVATASEDGEVDAVVTYTP